MINYRNEKPKLNFKDKEPKKEKEGMDFLKKELEDLYKEKEKNTKNYQETIKKNEKNFIFFNENFIITS